MLNRGPIELYAGEVERELAAQALPACSFDRLDKVVQKHVVAGILKKRGQHRVGNKVLQSNPNYRQYQVISAGGSC